MNNKAIIEFSLQEEMKNSADLGGCYLLRLKAKTKEIENQTWLKSLNPEFHFDLQ